MAKSKSATPRLLRGLSTTLSDATYEVDSPFKQKVRDQLQRAVAPVRRKSPEVTIEQDFSMVTLVDATPEQFENALSVTPVEIGGRDYLRLELVNEEGIVIVNTPEVESPTGEYLYRNVFKAWSMQNALKKINDTNELEASEWDNLGQKQKERAGKMGELKIAKEWEKDLSIRKALRDILEKLRQRGYVARLQKLPYYGKGTLCSHPYCQSPNGRTPQCSCRVSLEPPENDQLNEIPATAIGGKGRRGHAIKKTRWFCLVCWEDLCNGIGLITRDRLEKIFVDVDIMNGHKRRLEDSAIANKDTPKQDKVQKDVAEIEPKKCTDRNLLEPVKDVQGESSEFRENGQKRRKIVVLNIAKIGAGHEAEKPKYEYHTRNKDKRRPPASISLSPRKPAAGTGVGRMGKTCAGTEAPKRSENEITGLETLESPTRAEMTHTPEGIGAPRTGTSPSSVRKAEANLPKIPSIPYAYSEFLSLSQSLAHRMLPEEREFKDDWYRLPETHKAALLKWKTTIMRQQVKGKPQNLAKMEALNRENWWSEGLKDTTHDEMYWFRDDEDGQTGQIHGLVDPGGLLVNLTTADCYTEKGGKVKELSELMTIVDKKVADEWKQQNYEPPRAVKTLLKLKLGSRLKDPPTMTPELKEEILEDSDSGDDPESTESEEER